MQNNPWPMWVSIAALCISVGAMWQAHHPQRTVVLSSQPAAAAKASRTAWPTLGQAKTIAMGEALQAAGAGAQAQVTIYCSDPDCDLLMHDLDDALQIADWPSDFERGRVDAQSDRGLFIGPAGNPGTTVLGNALAAAGLQFQITETDRLAVIIGKRS